MNRRSWIRRHFPRGPAGQLGILGGVLAGAVVTVFLVHHFLHR